MLEHMSILSSRISGECVGPGSVQTRAAGMVNITELYDGLNGNML